MSIRRYLPSVKLVSIVLSLALSVGLVFAADRLTNRAAPGATVATDSTSPATADAGWEAALYAVQANNASSTFAAPDPNFVSSLLEDAQSSNVTDTVGKTILINISNAKSQGLGNDIPTQEQIVAVAASQIDGGKDLVLYRLSDIRIVAVNSASLHTYGNALMQVFTDNPSASQSDTFMAISAAVDKGSEQELKKLVYIKAGYAALTADLLALPVPQTLAPLHLLVVNDFVHITASFDDMRAMATDPLRGIAGLQAYQSSLAEVGRVFTNIAQALNKGGIIFSKDEPGSAWSAFISP